MSVQVPTLTVFAGPMFSSKTSRLLMELERFRFQHKHVAVFKPALDDRYDSVDVVSHSGWRHEARTIKEGVDILALLADTSPSADVVAVDEAFMVPNVAEVLVWLYRSGIHVVVSTLDLSYAGKPFREVEKLMTWATRVEKCTAVCTECGGDAHYTHRKQLGDEEIQVGGSELYEPRCFQHHLAIDNRLTIHE